MRCLRYLVIPSLHSVGKWHGNDVYDERGFLGYTIEDWRKKVALVRGYSKESQKVEGKI